MTIEIRPPRHEGELHFIAEGFEETIACWEDYQVTPERIAARVTQLNEWIENPDFHLVIALTSSGMPAGFNSLSAIRNYNGEPMGKVIILWVNPRFRRLGIGRALKREGEAWMRSRGIRRVRTEIDARNERMLQINQAAGFKIKSYVFERLLEDVES